MARVTQYSIPATRSTYLSLQQESELVVAILRIALIILAVLSPVLDGGLHATRLAMQASVLSATCYNAIVLYLYWRRVRLRGQRQMMLLADILLATTWIYLTWNVTPGGMGSPLFPFYFLVVITGALWFGVSGALTCAGIISALYLLMLYQVSGHDPFTLIDTLYRQIIYIFLVAITSGYLADTHKREREQWTRSQVLLAQYQERFRAAQEVYELLIPNQAPQVPGLQLAARWRPALQEGGGDFYDAIPLKDGRVILTIADVSGKHSRGALKLPLFKAAFMACAQVWEDPGQVLSEVNRIVYPQLQPEMFITACVVIIDVPRQRLLFANAGQDPPVFVRAGTLDTITLNTGGLILGIDPQATYPTEEQRLEPGDTLCLYTDGITEARNGEGEEFGYPNLEARVQSAVAVGLPAEQMAENIFDAVNRHAHEEGRRDDMTLLVVRYFPEEPEEPTV